MVRIVLYLCLVGMLWSAADAVRVKVPSRKGSRTSPQVHARNIREPLPRSKNTITSQNGTYYTVDLDEDPATRWSAVIHDFYEPLQNVDVMFPYPAKYKPLVTKVAQSLVPYFGIFGEEMIGIAKLANLTLEQVFVLNMGYELSNGCMSIVARDLLGFIHHGRDTDSMHALGPTAKDELRTLMLEVRFIQGGKTVYWGSTLAGFTGLISAMSPGGISMTLNARLAEKGTLWESAFEAFLNNGKISSFQLRQMVHQNMSYTEGNQFLTTMIPLVAPVYMIIGGETDGAVYSYSRTKLVDTWILSETNSFFLVQGNSDHWTGLNGTDGRRAQAIKGMNELGPAGVSDAGILQVLQEAPVLNEWTLYSAVMSVHNNSYSTVFYPTSPPSPP